MSNQDLFDSKKIHMLDAGILAFEVNNQKEEYLFNDNWEGFVFHVESKDEFNMEDKLARIVLEVSVDGRLGNGEIVNRLGYFKFYFTYQVDNLDELVIVNNDTFQIDWALGVHLVAISYSTSRGLILAKVSGTCLDGAILPITDPSELLGDKEEKSDVAGYLTSD